MGKRKRILFFTSSEYGQANVIIAVAYELLVLQQYEIHIASFEPLRQRINGLNKFLPQDGIPIIFHSIVGPAALDALVAKDEFIGPYSPGVHGALNTYRVTLPAMADTWTEAEYMSSYQTCLGIIRSVGPKIIIADPLMSQGLEACNTLSRKHVVLSPNTFLELLRKKQSLFSQFFRIPTIASGFSYPIPWQLIPANIYLKLALIWILVTSPKVRALIHYRKANKLPSLPPVFNIWQEDNHYLLPSVPETDYPCHVPPNVTPCGPILLPVTPVSHQDPDLFTWLKRGPTILINLGSHIRMDDIMAREFASGLKIFLDKKPNVQVLWKLKTFGGVAVSSKSKPGSGGFTDSGLGRKNLATLSAEISNGRIRIVEWLSVDPLAILETGIIACSAHHGGSNSFHEALSAGVPQVVLPCWLDTLDFANKVEWLGIGVYGSKMSAPSVEAWELSRAFLKVLGDNEEASQMALRARELANISGKVGGRKKACDKIVELLENSW
ncbi:UDP-glucoronosyl and UDP-glucosyl transferase family protein [Rhexocercosporidium sp. MPI-PUGE-AT-0058]|nr:UDP-glucoronosyl and UDP-glucosyl transferase family protein [Rhexocercosporidium sp. MPI-PUGE-AT-0058]